MACLVVSGCVGVSKYAISRPVSETSGINISGVGRIALGDVVVFVSPTNVVEIVEGLDFFPYIPIRSEIEQERQNFWSGYYQNSDRRNPGFFILEVFFEVGQHSVVFSPSKVVLLYKGEGQHPINIYELFKNRESTGWVLGHHPDLELCAGKEKGPYAILGNPLITLDKFDKPMKRKGMGVPEKLVLEKETKHCFALEFPISPPDPRDEFSLEFGYLFIDGRNVPIRIKYVPDTFTRRSA